MTIPLTVEELQRFPLFDGIPTLDLEHVHGLLSHDAIPRNLEVIKHGDQIRVLWLLIAGECEVVKPMPNGEKQVLARLDPGAVFGELSFFDPAPHSASVRSVTDVEVLWLKHNEFQQLETCCPAAAHRIMINTGRLLAQRLRKMDEWICDLLKDPNESQKREEWQTFRAKLYTEWNF